VVGSFTLVLILMELLLGAAVELVALHLLVQKVLKMCYEGVTGVLQVCYKCVIKES
jgi:hypothetical protein